MKFYKILFFNTLILGTFISISAYSWMAMWIGLEINLLSFIPLMKSENKFSSESAFKYFIIQALASMMILFSINLNLIFTDSFLNSISFYLINSAFLIKMGCAPFHFWFIEVIEGLSWLNSLLILTWQKIAPMTLLMYTFFSNYYLMFIIISSLTVSGFKSWNQTKLKKILALSSINHMSWMLSILYLNHSIWLFYFLIYSFMNLSLILIFLKYNTIYLSQMFSIMKFNKSSKILFFSNFFSLAGLPPFLGFFPKWLVISTLMEKNFYLLSLLLIMFTLLMMYIYLNLSFNALMLNINETKMKFFTIENNTLFFLNMFNLLGLGFSSLMFIYF
uniref:NADH-ubiquinone oxidoreductase chain 2 n=1 Tax=Cucujoidea sp. 10 KM-2017 TaxID=2219346 RepID=A0A346RJR2_9CUCU|nr:NADH dehydrogenase subunit 2 [Cucujoidea sp. 10 KM-2017]